MKKLFTLLFIILLSCIIASVYGILHDQFTYSISPEYYTKYKFPMFGLDYDGASSNERLLVALTGIIATWWVGLIIGTIQGLVALLHSSPKAMFRYAIRAIGITMVIAIVTGLIGLGYGWLTSGSVDYSTINMVSIATINDPKAFYMVGCMHNASYIGGAIGLIAGIIYIIRQSKAV